MNRSLNFIADSLEMLVNDLIGTKRPRRRAIARKKTRTYTRRQRTPVLIIME